MSTTSYYDYNSTSNDTSNYTTTESRGLDQGLYYAYNSMLIAITIIIMFSMGTGITFQHLRTIFRRPVGPIIGVICQCLLMPACCCGYALLLGLPANIAIGMVLTGSTPGGTISNIIVFWAKADIILSICMTTISTTLSIGFLPLNMFIYSRFWIDDTNNIPFENMIFTILYLWAAVIIGFLVGRRWPKTIPYFTRIGSIIALIMILSAGFIQNKLYPELFELSWQTYLAGGTMPIIGFVIGFVLSSIVCLGIKQKLAIGFETGIQNTSLALTIIAVTYKSSYETSYYSQFVILYTTVQVVVGIAAVVIIWIYNGIRYRESPCATRQTFGLDPSAAAEVQVGPTQTGQVTVDDSELGPQLVSVVDRYERLHSTDESTLEMPPPNYDLLIITDQEKQNGFQPLTCSNIMQTRYSTVDSNSDPSDASDDKQSTDTKDSDSSTDSKKSYK